MRQEGLAVTVPYTGSVLPSTIDISGIPDGLAILCVSAAPVPTEPTIDSITFEILASPCEFDGPNFDGDGILADARPPAPRLEWRGGRIGARGATDGGDLQHELERRGPLLLAFVHQLRQVAIGLVLLI